MKTPIRLVCCTIWLLTPMLTYSQINAAKSKKQLNMNTDKLTNPTVKAAFDAWQSGDSKTWLSFFTPYATLYDDGNARDFHTFSTQAIGHERFISIDNVEDDGKSIYGQFHSDQWGNFKTYFRFHLNRADKIERLDIGQAN